MDDTRERILFAAMRLFAEKGYLSTSVADILKEAGAHSGSLYHFFPTKQDVLVAVLGLYRDDGELHMVGGAASFTAKDRITLLAELEPLRDGDQVNDGEPSRWNSAADKQWIPIRPEKVAPTWPAM